MKAKILPIFVMSLLFSVFLQPLQSTFLANDFEIIDDSEITPATTVGSYPVVISYTSETGEKIEKTIYVTIYYRQTVENIFVYEAIHAHDLIVEEDVVMSLSDEDLLKIIDAYAWNIKTGESVPIVYVERTLVDEENKLYNVTIGTENKTEMTVEIMEHNKAIMQPENISNQYLNLFKGRFSIVFASLAMLTILIALLSISILLFSYYKQIKLTFEIEKLLNYKEK